MANLPQQQTYAQQQTKWAAMLNPVINNQLIQGQMVTASLVNGDTVINHKLGRQMLGWFITDIDGAATIYRSAPFNSLTLTLTSNTAVDVSLWVF